MLIVHAASAFLLAMAAVQSGPALPRAVRAIGLDGVEGRIDHMAVDAQSRRLYVAALGHNTVEVLDLGAGARVQTLRGLAEPQGICVIPDSGKVVVASGKDGKVRIYDRSLKLLGETGDLDDADNVRYDAAAGRIYVGYGDGALAVIDPKDASRLASIRLDGHPESFQLEAGGQRIFVNVPTARQIAVVDRGKRAVIARWPVNEAKDNFPMALDESHHRLLVACRKPARLLALDTQSGNVVASMACCGDADDVFYDDGHKRVYVSGGEGSISVFDQVDPDNYRLLDTIRTAPGARTSLLMPQMGSLYVAVPHRGQQKAQIRVFEVTKAPG